MTDPSSEPSHHTACPRPTTPAGAAPARSRLDRGAATPARPRDTLMEWGRTLIYAVLIAIVFRTFLFQPFSIPSSSMEPTLLIGDYLFVNKFTYGYRFRLPKFLGGDEHEHFTLVDVMTRPPERGDVIVFKKPSDGHTDYIKRVIGLPGETVQMRQGRLYINDRLVSRVLVREEPAISAACANTTVPVYSEELPGAQGADGTTSPPRDHIIQETCGDASRFDDTQEFQVPAGHYLVMGDNRDNSTDGRSRDVGFVPDANIVGRAEIIFFSLGDDTAIWQVWKWPWAIRLARLGQGIL